MAQMPADEYRNRVTSLIDSAADFVRDEISEQRQKTLRYLRGEVDVPNPGKGRSRVVVTETRDTLCQMIPQLMRIFTGADTVVEFQPLRKEDEPLARQQTDYINHVLMVQNPGWRLIHDGIYDGLAGMLGAWYAYYDERTEVWEESYSNLSPDEFAQLSADPDGEVIEHEETHETETVQMQIDDGTLVSEQVELVRHDCRVRYKETKRQLKVECIPPEEIVVDRRTTSVEDALVLGRLGRRTKSDLIAAGLPKDKIEEADEGEDSGDKDERTGYPQTTTGSEDEDERVEVFDGYLRIDKDGDDIAEWRHVIALGESREVVIDEMVRGPQIIPVAPYRRAHAMFGDSVGTLTEDLQDLNTALTRGMIDNLNFSTIPRPVVGPGVHMDDLLNHAPGVPIRSRMGVAQVQWQQIPFAGAAVLPVLEHLEQRKEGRTGVSRAAMGLDPDSLQSTSSFGVRELFTMGQSRTEMVARTIAEMGFKPLFKLLLRLIAENEDAVQIVRLRGEWVDIDPRQFKLNMDLVVNVGLGTGTREERAQALSFVLQQQKEAIAAAGESRFAGAKHVYNTIVDFMKLFGFRGANRYFGDPGDEPLQEPQEGPDPETQAKLQIEQAKLEIEREKVQQELALKREQMQAEFEMKRMDAERRHQLRLEEMRLEAQLRSVEISSRSQAVSTNIPRS